MNNEDYYRLKNKLNSFDQDRLYILKELADFCEEQSISAQKAKINMQNKGLLLKISFRNAYLSGVKSAHSRIKIEIRKERYKSS